MSRSEHQNNIYLYLRDQLRIYLQITNTTLFGYEVYTRTTINGKDICRMSGCKDIGLADYLTTQTNSSRSILEKLI